MDLIYRSCMIRWSVPYKPYNNYVFMQSLEEEKQFWINGHVVRPSDVFVASERYARAFMRNLDFRIAVVAYLVGGKEEPWS